MSYRNNQNIDNLNGLKWSKSHLLCNVF